MSEASFTPLRHAILGPGGVGGLVGAYLAHAGHPVTLVVRSEALAKQPTTLRLEGPFGEFEVDVTTTSDVPAVDVLWITVKATHLDSALAAVKDPGAARAIVPLLNGIDHIPLLRARFGSDRVIPATIAVETERVSPGRIVQKSPFSRLSMSSMGTSLLGATLDQFQKIGFECRFVDSQPTLMWGKLVFLAPFALCTTAADKTVGEILADPQWRSLGEACVREACAVGMAEGAKVEPGAVMTGVAAMPSTMRSSMQKDVEQNKMPELDAIAGPILRGGKRHRIDVPATAKLVAAVENRWNARHSTECKTSIRSTAL